MNLRQFLKTGSAGIVLALTHPVSLFAQKQSVVKYLVAGEWVDVRKNYSPRTLVLYGADKKDALSMMAKIPAAYGCLCKLKIGTPARLEWE